MSKVEQTPELGVTGRGQMIDRKLYKKLRKKADKAQNLLFEAMDMAGVINARHELEGIVCADAAPEVFGPVLAKRIDKAADQLRELRDLLDKEPPALHESLLPEASGGES